MSEPIRVSYVRTADEFVRGFKRYTRANARLWYWFAWAFFAAMLFLGWQARHGSVFFSVFYVVCGLIVMVARGPLMPLMLRRRVKSRPDKATIEFEIDAEMLRSRAADLGTSEFTWNAITSAVIADAGILLFLTPRQYIHFPAPGFDGDGMARLTALIEEKVPKIKRLR